VVIIGLFLSFVLQTIHRYIDTEVLTSTLTDAIVAADRKEAVLVIQLRVRDVAEARGITNIKMLAARASLAYDTARDLWHGRMQRIDRDVLARVCVALQCEPGDVLVMEESDSFDGMLTLQPLRLSAT
jgi:DNA-binding Xre family transcriptional regulator